MEKSEPVRISAWFYYPALYVLSVMLVALLPDYRNHDVTVLIGAGLAPFLFGAMFGRFHSRTAGIVAVCAFEILIWIGQNYQ